MLPVLLDAGTSDVTPLIIEALGVGFSAMASLLATITLAKLGSLTKKDEALAKKLEEEHEKVHQNELAITKLQAFATWASVELGAVKTDMLPWLYFKQATASQNKAINAQTDTLADIKAKLDDLERSKATRSEMNMPAARYPSPKRPPLSRTEPVSEPPEDLPPMRAELPSSIT